MKCNTLRLKQLDSKLVESILTSSIGKVIDEAPLLSRKMLHDFPLQVLAPLIFAIVIIFIIWITTFSSFTGPLLWASQAVAIQASVAVIAVLVIAFFVVGSWTVMGTPVDTRPVLAADVAKFVTAFAAGLC
jgi:hypothetical protein